MVYLVIIFIITPQEFGNEEKKMGKGPIRELE